MTTHQKTQILSPHEVARLLVWQAPVYLVICTHEDYEPMRRPLHGAYPEMEIAVQLAASHNMIVYTKNLFKFQSVQLVAKELNDGVNYRVLGIKLGHFRPLTRPAKGAAENYWDEVDREVHMQFYPNASKLMPIS